MLQHYYKTFAKFKDIVMVFNIYAEYHISLSCKNATLFSLIRCLSSHIFFFCHCTSHSLPLSSILRHFDTFWWLNFTEPRLQTFIYFSFIETSYTNYPPKRKLYFNNCIENDHTMLNKCCFYYWGFFNSTRHY